MAEYLHIQHLCIKDYRLPLVGDDCALFWHLVRFLLLALASTSQLMVDSFQHGVSQTSQGTSLQCLSTFKVLWQRWKKARDNPWVLLHTTWNARLLLGCCVVGNRILLRRKSWSPDIRVNFRSFWRMYRKLLAPVFPCKGSLPWKIRLVSWAARSALHPPLAFNKTQLRCA